jgi:hypothetical protein
VEVIVTVGPNEFLFMMKSIPNPHSPLSVVKERIDFCSMSFKTLHLPIFKTTLSFPDSPSREKQEGRDAQEREDSDDLLSCAIATPLPGDNEIVDSNKFRGLSQEQQTALACLSELAAVIGVSPIWNEPQEEHSTQTQTSKQQLVLETESSSLSNSKPAVKRRSLFDKTAYEPILHSPTPIRISKPVQQRSHSASRQPGKSLLKRSEDSSGSLKRSVSFSNLEIREYEVALSDHPDCSYGPPIQLDWEYTTQNLISIDDYEQTRSPRSTGSELKLPCPLRKHWLLTKYTKQELHNAVQEVERVKRERRKDAPIMRGELLGSHVWDILGQCQ